MKSFSPLTTSILRVFSTQHPNLVQLDAFDECLALWESFLQNQSPTNGNSASTGFTQTVKSLFKRTQAGLQGVQTSGKSDSKTPALDTITPTAWGTFWKSFDFFWQQQITANQNSAKIAEIQNLKSALRALFIELQSSQANLATNAYFLALRSSDCSASTLKNYRSDINQFLRFANESDLSRLMAKPKVAKFLENEQTKELTDSSIRRKRTSISLFANWAVQNNWLQGTDNLDDLPNSGVSAISVAPVTETKTITPVVVAKKSFGLAAIGAALRNTLKASNTLLPIFNLGLLILFLMGLSWFGYRQFTLETPEIAAFPAQLTRPSRVLSFQGRLTDTVQNPITTSTNMQFRLYNQLTGGTLLWNSGTCSVTPDQDGIFSTGLGSDCGSEISSDVFSENQAVYLEVQVASETLTPRQPIRTVAYAINSEALQGFPPADPALESTVLVLDEFGNLNIGTTSPTITSTTGTFTIEGQALQLQTATGSNGDITLSPDGTGDVLIESNLDVQDSVRLGAAGVNNVLNTSTATGSATGRLYWGDEELAYLTDIVAGGVTSVSGTTNQITAAPTTGDVILSLPSDLRAPGTFNATTSIATGAGAGTVRLDSSGNLSNIGTISASGAIGTAGSITSTAGLLSIQGAGDNYLAGNLGLGTATPSQKLDVTGAIRLGAVGANNVLHTSTAAGPATGRLYWGDEEIAYLTDIASLGGITSVSGTTNQITAITSVTDVTLSLPSDLRAPGTFNATTSIATGAGAGTVRIDSSGNLTNIGIVNTSGNVNVSSTLTLNTNGIVYGTGIANKTTANNSYLNTSATGLIASRNIADANVAMIIRQTHASSTGDILQLQNDLGTVVNVTQDGRLGLGTTTPSELLDVLGAIRLGAVGVNNVLNTSTATGSATGNLFWGNAQVVDTSNIGSFAATSVTGTTNQITAAPTNGDVILSLPSDLRAPGTFNATTSIATGAGAGTVRLDSSGNLSNIGTISSTYLTTSTNIVNIAGASTALQMNGVETITSGRLARLADGAALTPAFSFTSDPDSGFYNADVNELGFSTDGTERVRISDTGLVGIGTSSPSERLDVLGAIRLGAAGVNNVLNTTTATGSATGRLFWGDEELAYYSDLTSGAVTSVTGTTNQITASPTFGDVILSLPSDMRAPGTFNATTSIATGAGAGTVRIDASGNLTNIGTISSTYLSTTTNVVNIAGASTVLQMNGVETITAGRLIRAGDGSAANPAFSFTSNPTSGMFSPVVNELAFSTDGVERLRIDSNGNVGIGTSTPGARLDIGGAASIITNTAGDITIDAASNTISFAGDLLTQFLAALGANGTAIDPTFSFTSSTGTGMFSPTTNVLGLTTDGTERLRITDTGRVGIGTTSPTSKFHVEGSVDGKALAIFNQLGDQDLLVASHSGNVRFRVDTNGYTHAQRFADLANPAYFLDPAATNISLTTAGSAGIGITTPESRLHVQGDAQFGNDDENDVAVRIFGNLFKMGDTKITTSLTDIKGSYLYDTATDKDGGAWRNSTISRSLSWFTETKDDSMFVNCDPTTHDRCGESQFPGKANIVYTDDALYIFDVSTNKLWMKFTRNTYDALRGSDTTITSVTAKNGRIFVGTIGNSNRAGIYELNFQTDTVFWYSHYGRAPFRSNIANRNDPAATLLAPYPTLLSQNASQFMPAFALSHNNVNGLDLSYNAGRLQLAAATDSGVNLIDLEYKPQYEYVDVASNGNTIFAPTKWIPTQNELEVASAEAMMITIGDYVYKFGGFNGGYLNVIHRAPVANPTQWENTGSTLPVNLMESSVAVIGDYVYLFGGRINTTYTNAIYRAPVSDPTNWTTTGNTLPGNLAYSNLAVIGDYVYLFGGFNGSANVSVIYRAALTDPLTWTNTGNTIPAIQQDSQIAVLGDYVYLFGGSPNTTAIYRAPISDPLTWANTGSTLPVAFYQAQLQVIDDYVYLFAGFTGVNSNAIYRAPVSDPTTWEVTGETMPNTLRLASGSMVINDKLYIYGGYNGSAYTGDILQVDLSDPYDTISSDGSGTTQLALDAFDFSTTTYARSDASDNVYILTYEVGTPTIVSRYTLTPRAAAGTTEGPAAWTLKASTTGAFAGEEVTLDTVTGKTWNTTNTQEYIRDLNNTTAYSYYRLHVTDAVSVAADQIDIAKFRLLSKHNSSAAADLRYSSAVRIFSESVFDNYQPDVSSMFDTTTYSVRRVNDWARTGASGEWYSAIGNTKPWLQLTLRNPKVVTQYSVAASSDNNTEPTSWTVEASNNGTDWTVLDTRTSEDFNTYQVRTFTFTNSTEYKFYRLNVTATRVSTAYSEIGEFMVHTPVITTSSALNTTQYDAGGALMQDGGVTDYFWMSALNQVTDQWIKYDYGDQPPTIHGYSISGASTVARSVRDFILQGSNDDSTWTDLDTQLNHPALDTWTTNYTFDLAAPATYRYYRLFIDTNNGDANYVSLRNFSLYGAEERIITSSESTSALLGRNLFDEGDFGSWTSLAGDRSPWIEKQFSAGQAASASAIAITGHGSASPRDFTVYGSSDRQTWTKLLSKDGVENNTTATQTFRFESPDRINAYQYYRIKLDTPSTGTNVSIAEIKLLGARYTNVRFSGASLVATNGTHSQLEMFNDIWTELPEDQNHRDLRFDQTSAITTNLDTAVKTNPSTTTTTTRLSMHSPILTGAITHDTKTLEVDGNTVYVGHANGMDVVQNDATSDATNGNAPRARVSATYNTNRIIANKYGFNHYFPMEEAAGATHVRNYGTWGLSSEVLGYRSTNNQSVPTAGVDGKIGKAFSFDRTQLQYISVNNLARAGNTVTTSDTFSMGGWVYLDDITGTNGILSDFISYSCSGTCYGGVALQVLPNANATGNQLRLQYGTGVLDSAPIVNSDVWLPNNQWVHIVVQQKNGNLYFYQNGELVDVTTGITSAARGNQLYIGSRYAMSTTTETFNGELDEIFVKYGDTLTDEQIKELYAEGLISTDATSASISQAVIPIADGDSSNEITATATAGTSTTITLDATAIKLVPDVYRGRVLEITAGTGSSQSRIITSNTTNVITVSPAFTTTPDATSEIRIAPNALPGTTNAISAVRADQKDIFIGLNDGSDNGGVVRIDRKTQSVVDYYHGHAGKVDEHSATWTNTAGFDNIVGISTSQNNLLIAAQNQYWHEKVGGSIWDIIDTLQQSIAHGIIDTHTQDFRGGNTRNLTKTVLRKGWNYLGTDAAATKEVFYGISYDTSPLVFLSQAGRWHLGDVPSSLSMCSTTAYQAESFTVANILTDRFSAMKTTGAGQGTCFTWMSLGDYSSATPDGSFASGADLAEWYGTDDETLTAGEIVSIDESGDIKVVRSNQPQDPTSVGIIATQPAITLGTETGLTPGYSNDPQLKKSAKTAVQVALAGRVPVRVSLENGPIKAGDYLTTGSVPGVAVKALSAGPVIGKAMENFDGTHTVVGLIHPESEPSLPVLQGLSDGMVTATTTTPGSNEMSELEFFESQETATESASALSSLLNAAEVDETSVQTVNDFTTFTQISTNLEEGAPITINDPDLQALEYGYGVIMAFVNTGYGEPEVEFTTDPETNQVTLNDHSAKLVPSFARSLIEYIKTQTNSAQIFVSDRVQVFTRFIAQDIFTQNLRTEMISPVDPDGDIIVKLGGDSATDSAELVEYDENGNPIPASESAKTDARSQKLSIQDNQGNEVAAIRGDGSVTFLGELEVKSNASISGSLAADTVKTTTLTSDNIQSRRIFTEEIQTESLLAKEMRADKVSTTSLAANQFAAQSARISQLEAGLAQFKSVNAQTALFMDATVSGTLYVNQIANLDEEIARQLREPSLFEKLLPVSQQTQAERSLGLVNNPDQSLEAAQQTSNELAKLLEEAEQLRASFTNVSSALNTNTLATDLEGSSLTETLFATNMLAQNIQADVVRAEYTFFAGAGTVLGDGYLSYSPPTIDDESSSVKPRFEIQPSGTGVLSFMAGLLTLDQDGYAIINGDLFVAGDLAVQGSLLADLLTPTDYSNPFQIQLATSSASLRTGEVAGATTEATESANIAQTDGVTRSRFEIVDENGSPVATISASGLASFKEGLHIDSDIQPAGELNPEQSLRTTKTTGVSTVTKGSMGFTILSERISEDSLIYVTPLGPADNQVLYVKEKVAHQGAAPEQMGANGIVIPARDLIEGRFIVGFQDAATRDVRFNWWIVN